MKGRGVHFNQNIPRNGGKIEKGDRARQEHVEHKNTENLGIKLAEKLIPGELQSEKSERSLISRRQIDFKGKRGAKPYRKSKHNYKHSFGGDVPILYPRTS